MGGSQVSPGDVATASLSELLTNLPRRTWDIDSTPSEAQEAVTGNALPSNQYDASPQQQGCSTRGARQAGPLRKGVRKQYMLKLQPGQPTNTVHPSEPKHLLIAELVSAAQHKVAAAVAANGSRKVARRSSRRSLSQAAAPGATAGQGLQAASSAQGHQPL